MACSSPSSGWRIRWSVGDGDMKRECRQRSGRAAAGRSAGRVAATGSAAGRGACAPGAPDWSAGHRAAGHRAAGHRPPVNDPPVAPPWALCAARVPPLAPPLAPPIALPPVAVLPAWYRRRIAASECVLPVDVAPPVVVVPAVARCTQSRRISLVRIAARRRDDTGASAQGTGSTLPPIQDCCAWSSSCFHPVLIRRRGAERTLPKAIRARIGREELHEHTPRLGLQNPLGGESGILEDGRLRKRSGFSTPRLSFAEKCRPTAGETDDRLA